tara:strand:+ start:756 stop:1457 length:702 start_codon:yes stop_codon:yes gene_type:complete
MEIAQQYLLAKKEELAILAKNESPHIDPKLRSDIEEEIAKVTNYLNDTATTQQGGSRSQMGGTPDPRAHIDEKFMKNYITEYVRIDTTILSNLYGLTKIVETIYDARDVTAIIGFDIDIYLPIAFDIIRELSDIINSGAKNEEQQYLLTARINNNNIPGVSMYASIMQRFIDMLSLITNKNRYIEVPATEAEFKQHINDLFILWKDQLIQDNLSVNNSDFEQNGKYKTFNQIF